MTTSTPGRLAVLARGAAALIVLVALTVGVPILLLEMVGNPIPTTWSWTQPVTNDAILAVLACVAWLLWAQMVVCLIVEVIAEVRIAAGRSADWLSRAPGTFTGQQALVRTLVQAVVAVGLTSAAVAVSPLIARADTHSVAASTHTSETSAEHSKPTPPDPAVRHAPDHRHMPMAVVTVTKGDSLWSIAEQHLGNGERWREIARLNERRLMPDGNRFHHAASILPGWTVLVPATSPGAQPGDLVTVEQGDDLWALAEQAYGDGSDWPDIFNSNRTTIDNPDLIYPGQRLRIPNLEPARPRTRGEDRHQTEDEFEETNHTQRDQAAPLPTVEPTSPAAGIPTPGPSDAPPHGKSVTTNRSESPRHEYGSSTLARALVGGGAFLAAGLFAALAARRRAQFRNRRSGRTILTTPDPLVDAETTVRATGSASGEAARFLDLILRDLASGLRRSGGTQPPEVQALRIDDTRLELFLSDPAHQPPSPWLASDDGRVWRIGRGHPPRGADAPAPYPTLVSIGVDNDGGTWMLDLEAAGLVHLTGELTAAADLARFIAAELAMNPWANTVDVNVSRVATELVPLNPSRLSHCDPVDLEKLTKAARRVREATEAIGLGVLAGRIQNQGADSWMPTIAIADARSEQNRNTIRETDRLLDELGRLDGRNAVALVAINPGSSINGGLTLSLAADGRLVTPWATVAANRLSAEDAETLADLFTAADTVDDETMPTGLRTDGSRRDTDVAGALTAEVTDRRTGTGDPDSLLPRPDEQYLATAATTVDDLAALAPRVPPANAARIIQSDPGLDADLAAWSDPQSSQPKLRLLGPVEIRVAGARPHEVERRPAYYAELLAYLATRPDGATPQQMADAFSIQHNTLHTRIAILRKWLGTNPATGSWYLPESTLSPAARARGVPVYQLEGVLCDTALFQRLRARGQARGPEGIEDLTSALAMVTGTPFDQLRPGGYGWLADTPVNHYLTAAIVDVAHIVATHALADDDPALAVWAAERAITAAPSEDKPRLDLAQAKIARGQVDEARGYIESEVHNRSDDDSPPPEPSARTIEVLGLKGDDVAR